MTDSDPADSASTGRPASRSQGRHRAPGEAAATPGWLPRTALAGLAVVALAAGVLVTTGAAGTPTRQDVPQPSRTGSSGIVGPARLSLGAPPGARLLPAAPVRVRQPVPATPAAVHALAAAGIPAVALNAYRLAAARMASARPDCGVPWWLLAGIGRIESNHGRYGGAALTAAGESRPHIIGPALDGTRYDYIADTDGGRLDADSRYDHAVGPMQFIPSTWAMYGADGNGDGIASPFNVNDAALAAARYLCAAGGDLRTAAGQRRAVLAYNHSDEYLALVLATARAYATGTALDGPIQGVVTGPLPPVDTSWLPPVNPGRPVAAAFPGAAGASARPSGGSAGTGTSGGSAGTGPSGGGSSSGGSSSGGSSGGGSTGTSSPGGGSTGSGSAGSSPSSSPPAPGNSTPTQPEPSESSTQPASPGLPGLPLPSVTIATLLPSATSTGCTQTVLGVVVPVPCGPS